MSDILPYPCLRNTYLRADIILHYFSALCKRKIANFCHSSSGRHSCIATAVIFYKHRENFPRMLNGTELGLRSAMRGDNRIKEEKGQP